MILSLISRVGATRFTPKTCKKCLFLPRAGGGCPMTHQALTTVGVARLPSEVSATSGHRVAIQRCQRWSQALGALLSP
jgi:hypothetical protein